MHGKKGILTHTIAGIHILWFTATIVPIMRRELATSPHSVRFQKACAEKEKGKKREARAMVREVLHMMPTEQ